jgi:hypothetical protein
MVPIRSSVPDYDSQGQFSPLRLTGNKRFRKSLVPSMRSMGCHLIVQVTLLSSSSSSFFPLSLDTMSLCAVGNRRPAVKGFKPSLRQGGLPVLVGATARQGRVDPTRGKPTDLRKAVVLLAYARVESKNEEGLNNLSCGKNVSWNWLNPNPTSFTRWGGRRKRSRRACSDSCWIPTQPSETVTRRGALRWDPSGWRCGRAAGRPHPRRAEPPPPPPRALLGSPG